MSAPVLHLLPFDLARGAQVYAQALVDVLDTPGEPHGLVTLYRAPQAVLRPTHALDTPIGPLRRTGFDARVWRRLRRLVRQVRPRALVAHGSEPLKYAVTLPAGPPVVAFRIGVSALDPRSARGRWFTWQLRAADALVGVSDEVLDESIQRFGVPADRCTFIPNGRDARVYRPPDEPRAVRPRLVFVGHWDENKRPEQFIELVRRLRSDRIDLDAIMVGDGPRMDALAPDARTAGVEVLGRRSDVPDLLRGSHVLVLCSRMEGMPGVLVEAGLCGLPVVTTEVPGARTVLEDGVTGLVVGTDDLDGLVTATAGLLRDPARRASMGEAAVSRCRERFSLQTGAVAWRAVIDRVATGA